MSDSTPYTKLVIESIIMKKPLKTAHISGNLIEYAKTNKILYLLGLHDKRIQYFSSWWELKTRREEQKKALVEVVSIAEKLHIDIMIVKTIKPFEYVPDDIDILVINNEAMKDFIEELQKRGYFLRKKGTPEITLRKISKSTFVDLDIHTKMAAGTYEYIDKYYLWKRRTYVKLNDFKIFVPNEVDELLITVAHAIMKEFIITIADIIHVISLEKQIIENAIYSARDIGLFPALDFFISTTNKLLMSLLESYKGNSKQYKYPLAVPIPIVISTYVENVYYRLKRYGIGPVKELLKTPSSKGIGVLLRYIGL